MTNPLCELLKAGQSVWYDQMQRSLLSGGELKKMIKDDCLRGLTSNPTIFEKAIGGSTDYDELIRAMASKQKSTEEIYEAVIVDDLGQAADIFRSVYDNSGGMDGFVSLEVNPTLARNAWGSIEEGLKYRRKLDRPNVMIKIPATSQGLIAIEELTSAGVNVNITLIFSQAVYRKVIDAFMRGLERRADRGEPVGEISSVASFFVSRIDAKADGQIEKRISTATSEEEKSSLKALLGKIAIANAKVAYQIFKEEFGSARFKKLQDRGATLQRPLWASTGTKNKNYSDVLYIEQLIGPDTVNTIPPATFTAFRDHGKVIATLEDDVQGAINTLKEFAALGFSLDDITSELTEEGVESFSKSFASLLATIEGRVSAAMAK
ncbi:MAG TPA: transaldolase [Thermoanaerobaculia bacterium]|nr:transaldolase [Thermoanaerobaculia bacterium]